MIHDDRPLPGWLTTFCNVILAVVGIIAGLLTIALLFLAGAAVNYLGTP